MDKSSKTLLLLSSCLVFGTAAVYVSKQPQLQFIFLFSSSHPLLALNLLILLIIVSSRCFAISRHNTPADQRLLLDDSTEGIVPLCLAAQASDGIAEAPTSMSKKKGTPERTSKKTKQGSQLRQLKHSHSTTEDSITLTEASREEVTGPGSSSLSSAKLKKEVSLTKEEVNRRVERFIRKFNDD